MLLAGAPRAWIDARRRRPGTEGSGLASPGFAQPTAARTEVVVAFLRTGSTYAVGTGLPAIRVTRQSSPLRRTFSPIAGKTRRVKSYSKSPFG